MGLRIVDEGALLMDCENLVSLVIADLHIGYERELASIGIKIPSQVNKLTSRILKLIDCHKPDGLIVLGDLKHTVQGVAVEEVGEVASFINEVCAWLEDILIIPGNHDGNLERILPRGANLHEVRGLKVRCGEREVGLIHGHAWPSPEVLASDIIIMGHTHPAIELLDVSGYNMVIPSWVRLSCRLEAILAGYLKWYGISDVEEPREFFEEEFGVKLRRGSLDVLVMPAFNEMIGGTAINRDMKFLGPILRDRSAIIDSESDVWLEDGTYVGSLKVLRNYGEHPQEG